MSPRSAASDWVKTEVHWAMTNHCGYVIPVLISDCEPESVHSRLGQLQHVDFRQDLDRGREQLAPARGAVLPRVECAEGAPPPVVSGSTEATSPTPGMPASTTRIGRTPRGHFSRMQGARSGQTGGESSPSSVGYWILGVKYLQGIASGAGDLGVAIFNESAHHRLKASVSDVCQNGEDQGQTLASFERFFEQWHRSLSRLDQEHSCQCSRGFIS